MVAVTPNQLLMLYTWFPLSVGIAVTLLIARYYQKFSGQRTFYTLYLIPLVLFGAGSVRYASIDQIAGDGLGDVFMGSAGLILTGLCLALYYMMTSGRS